VACLPFARFESPVGGTKCVGGNFTPSEENNMPYRGLDSTYQNRWCSKGIVETDKTDPNSTVAIGVTPNSSICNHYEPYEVEEIPHITEHVKAALDFLSKDDDGFFLMYEQGDVSMVGCSVLVRGVVKTCTLLILLPPPTLLPLWFFRLTGPPMPTTWMICLELCWTLTSPFG
jgi:hypothetical protein